MVNGSSKWRDISRQMMSYLLQYLVHYYQRERSESGFSVDKRAFGLKLWQKLDERIDTAISYIAVLHNIFKNGYY